MRVVRLAKWPFIGKINSLARFLLDQLGADFRIDMRNMPIAVSRFLFAAFVALAGCSSTATQTTQTPNAPGNTAAAAATAANDDASLAIRVKSALSADPRLKPLPVSVATYRGVVQLSGYVDSEDQIQRAIAVARSVTGVQSVNNDLNVRPR
jgi:hyperosmotically inducible periplasmic protein